MHVRMSDMTIAKYCMTISSNSSNVGTDRQTMSPGDIALPGLLLPILWLVPVGLYRWPYMGVIHSISCVMTGGCSAYSFITGLGGQWMIVVHKS